MSTATEVRAVLNTRGALGALVSGSVVLAGRACGCIGYALRWAWEQASIDPEAQAAVQEHAKKVTAAKKVEGEEGQAALEKLGKAPSGRRPFPEALAYLAFGGMLAAGGAGTAVALLVPHLAVLAEWKPVILSVGGAGWMAAAWMVAPDPKPTKGQDDAAEESEETPQNVEESRGTALLWHVVRALADAESAGRAGLHLDTVLDSATEGGLIPEGTELPVMRAWVEAAGLPTVDKLGMRIGGKPVTRVGLRVDGATGALGMTPTALLAARSQTPAGGAPATRTQPVGETPAEVPASTPAEVPLDTPAGAPVPALLRLIPGGRVAPSEAPSPAPFPGSAQEAR